MITVFPGVQLNTLGKYLTFIRNKGFFVMQVVQEPVQVQPTSQLSLSKPQQPQMVLVYFPLVDVIEPLTTVDVEVAMVEWKKEIEKGA